MTTPAIETVFNVEEAAEALRMTNRRLIKLARQHGLYMAYGRQIMFTATQLADIVEVLARPTEDTKPDWLTQEAETLGLDLDAFLRTDHGYALPQGRPHYVYIIASEAYVKIGVSGNVERRLDDMRLSNPHKLELIHTEQTPCSSCSILAERTAHTLLQDVSVGREWFRAPPERAVRVVQAAAEAARRYCRLRAASAEARAA